MHPTPMIDLLRGLRGDAGCMGKAYAMYLILHCMLASCIGPFRVYISTATSCDVCCLYCMCAASMWSQARLFFATGTPVQPHDTSMLEGLDIKLRWCRLPPRCLPHVGLDKAANYNTFGTFFKLVPEPMYNGTDDEDTPPMS